MELFCLAVGEIRWYRVDTRPLQSCRGRFLMVWGLGWRRWGVSDKSFSMRCGCWGVRISKYFPGSWCGGDASGHYSPSVARNDLVWTSCPYIAGCRENTKKFALPDRSTALKNFCPKQLALPTPE